MKIVIPKVVVTVDLGEYAPELKGQSLHVWVNPPREVFKEYDALLSELQEKSLVEAREALGEGEQKAEGGRQKDEGGRQKAESPLGKAIEKLTAMVRGRRELKDTGIDAKMMEWYARIWSQGPEETRWTVAELRELEEQDPAFLSWAITQTWAMRNEHRLRKKKV